MEPEVATGSDPAQTQGDPQPSTLENLDTNVSNLLTDQNAGGTEPAPASEPPEPVKPDADGKMSRLSQDNANLRATLMKVGIDPDSQTAEQLRGGFITLDDILRTRMPQPQTEKPPQQTVPLDQKLANIQRTLESQKGDVTAEDYRTTQKQLLDVVNDLVAANQNLYQAQEKNQLTTLIDKTLTATKQVYTTSVASKVPETVREIGEKLFVGATDIAVGELAGQIGRERAFTPQAYTHVASKLAPEFDSFVNAIFQAGQSAAVNNIAPKNTKVVAPLAPGSGRGTAPPPAPKGQFSFENLDKNVDAFLSTTSGQI